jgi:hypothetical protein
MFYGIVIFLLLVFLGGILLELLSTLFFFFILLVGIVALLTFRMSVSDWRFLQAIGVFVGGVASLWALLLVLEWWYDV